MNGADHVVGTREGRRIVISGTVQGVGFRPWVYRLAHACGIGGRVRNVSDGVTIDAFGDPGALLRFEQRLRGSPPPASTVRSLRSLPIEPEPVADFQIVESRGDGGRRVSIPPDLATCPDCAAEIFDAGNRRAGYPFTNCTNCGPRFTIARDLPYDRATTTMAPFEMCEACAREYHSPGDRRFHAEPNACPVCGPRLIALTPDGTVRRDGGPIDIAAEALGAGRIVAVKGIGGFHLACDATSECAVNRLRQRKRRDEKPFAVMVRSIAAAEALAVLGPEERRLLESVERPIVLVPRRGGANVCTAVAPRNPLLGLLLPYSPLHHLLLAAVDRPLVMTSGNLSDEPLAWRNDEALSRLRDVADLFLMHDREIVAPCDDSVAQVIAGRPVLLRRARGYVPRPIPLLSRIHRPVLACGALLKNTFCIAAGEAAWLGPHVGDLEQLETCLAYESAIERMERFLRIDVEVIACDMHPDYLSTLYALGRREGVKVRVQHHHAHVASAMAEHNLEGPVLGVAYDGTGYGLDGTAWGAELLLATRASFERLATFRAIPLAGGDAAIRQPWRTALALVADAFGDDGTIERLALFRQVPERTLAGVRQMIADPVLAAPASGMGRYFDAFGALALGMPFASYEGQVALQWNLVADPAVHDAYGFEVDDRSAPWVIDLRTAVREAVTQILAGTAPSIVSARFHNTIAAATTAIVKRALRQHGALPVVLTGGCFQNARLSETIAGRLSGARVYTHGAVPPGDGGIALGQAIVADAIARGSA